MRRMLKFPLLAQCKRPKECRRKCEHSTIHDFRKECKRTGCYLPTKIGYEIMGCLGKTKIKCTKFKQTKQQLFHTFCKTWVDESRL